MAAQGLQGFAAAQGLQGFAAQGLQAAFFFTAQGLQAFAAQGLQAAICTEVSAALAAASGSATAPAETVATLSATRVFFSIVVKPPSLIDLLRRPHPGAFRSGWPPMGGRRLPVLREWSDARSNTNHAPAICFNFL
ncbi:hypothetical protein [Pelagibius sp.]|uniref:hypothetical protein n=1 Tax=Pelagibius sp. TaxID=1931238 RepID=UPI003BAF84B9